MIIFRLHEIQSRFMCITEKKKGKQSERLAEWHPYHVEKIEKEIETETERGTRKRGATLDMNKPDE